MALELDLLNDMLKSVYAKAVEGDTKAIGAVVKIMEQRSKLLGTEAEIKAATPTEMTEEQHRARLNEIFKGLAEAHKKAAENYGSH